MSNKLNEKQKEKVIESLRRSVEKALTNKVKLTWNSFLSCIGSFSNPSTGKDYKGMRNGILLSFTAMAYGGDPRFLGFGQTKKKGGCVKKGEKGTPIYRPIMFNKEDKDTGETKTVMGGFQQVMVFNVRQTTLIEKGIIPEKVAENVNTDSAPISSVTDFTSKIDFDEVVSRGCPYFSPMAGNIGMPPFEAFHNSFKHSESLLHELIHWTGHKNRLDRLPMGWTNKQNYSKEELVACLGSALLLNHLGVEASEEMEQNQTAYLQGWLSYLKDDISILLDASLDAVDAVNYLIKLNETVKEVREEVA